MAAADAATVADAPKDLSLMPHAYLAQLDPSPVLGNQDLDQLPKIDPGRSREVEYDLALIKAHLHIHQLHVQAQLPDLFSAEDHGLLAQLFILGLGLEILGIGQTLHGFYLIQSQISRRLISDHSHMSQSRSLIRSHQDPVLDTGLCRLILS